MRKFFYVAVAAVALMVASCAQKTPAEEALANYKAAIEKVNNFDGNEEDFMALSQEVQEAELEYSKYISEYSQETIEEVTKLSMEAAEAFFEKMANLKGGFDEEMEEITDEMEEVTGDVEEEIDNVVEEITGE